MLFLYCNATMCNCCIAKLAQHVCNLCSAVHSYLKWPSIAYFNLSGQLLAEVPCVPEHTSTNSTDWKSLRKKQTKQASGNERAKDCGCFLLQAVQTRKETTSKNNCKVQPLALGSHDQISCLCCTLTTPPHLSAKPPPHPIPLPCSHWLSSSHSSFTFAISCRKLFDQLKNQLKTFTHN